ncbi:MAG: aminomethyl-transferring glycine dehydrogenase subunit GcvPA [Promethearchaeota archaeon]
MDFSPLSEEDIHKMLDVIGVSKIDDLFVDVPEEIRNSALNIPDGLSEVEVFQKLKSLSKKNKVYDAFFCGAGIYNHFIPPVVNEVIRRGEFYTAYTPYQPEISQGFLQAIFEFQTVICNLTAMFATNASVYDGATALAESVLMAKNITRKNKILVLQPINPDYIKVLETYAFSNGFDVKCVSQKKLEDVMAPDEIAAVIVQNPNFLGELQDIKTLSKRIKNKMPKALIIYTVIETTSLGILKRPGTLGVDIVCGEGQPIGLPMSFGGPGLGFIATTKKYFRKLPGRIVGKTKELFGDNEGYILTLQAREQHIRREKALSNICSNEALCMLAVLVYLVSMGYSDFRKIAEVNIKNTFFLKTKIEHIEGYRVVNGKKPHYNEFLIESDSGIYDKIKKDSIGKNICPPYNILNKELDLISDGTLSKFDKNKDYFLVCNTEMNSLADINRFIKILEDAVK